MVKPAQDRTGNHSPRTRHVVVGSTKRDGLALALMRTALIEVADLLSEKPAQMLFAQEQRVIEALAAHTSDEALAESCSCSDSD